MQRSLFPKDLPTSKSTRLAIILGGVCGASGVALMALSAHADTTGLMRTAAEMLLFHAPAFLGLAALAQIKRIALLPIALVLLALGLALFCGDLLVRVQFEQRLFPMAAPSGGVLMILGWVAVALSALRIRSR